MSLVVWKYGAKVELLFFLNNSNVLYNTKQGNVYKTI